MTAPNSRAILKEAVERSFEDPAYFLRFFLPHWFPSAIPPFHLGLLAILTRKVRFLNDYPEAWPFLLEHFKYNPDPANADQRPLPAFLMGEDGLIKLVKPQSNSNWLIPRGFSKTTLVKGANLYQVLTDITSYIVLVSQSQGHSETQLLDLKTELEGNELLREAYGNQVSTRTDVEIWTAKELQLQNGATIVARGRGGQIRGITRQGRRPNIIVLDDIEDEESVATEAQRKKTRDWFYGSVVPAGQIMEGAIGQDWAQEPLRIINLGTLLNPEALAVHLARDETFSTVRFGALAAPNTPLWPFKMSENLYLRMRENYKRSGQLSHFTKEYDSLIRVEEDALFPQFYHYVPIVRSDLIACGQAMDPAISDKPTADEAAIVVAGRRASDGMLWFVDEWGGIGKTPADLIEQFFKFHIDWKTTHNGIEAVAYQAALLHLAREEMAKRKLFFTVTPILHGSKLKKENRVEGTLSPRYAANFIQHNKRLPKLESGLLDWPNGRKDFPDAAAMALNLLGETVGVVMEGALEDQPAWDGSAAAPARIPQVGNFLVRGSTIVNSPRNLPAGRNPRYGSR